MKFITSKNNLRLLISQILLCMACMNFFKRGSAIFLLFALWTGFIIVLKNKYIALDKQIIFPFFLSLAVFLSSVIYYDVNEIIKSLNYVLAFFVGYNLVYKSKQKTEGSLKFITSIYIGFLVYLFLTYLKNSKIGFNKHYRILIEFWNGEPIAVTLVGLLCSVIIGYSFYGIIIQKSRVIKIISILSLGLVFLINMKTATRTPFILFVCIYSMMGFFYFINAKNKRKIIVLFFIFILTLLFIIFSNTFGIRDYIIESSIFKRIMLEGIKTSRNNISDYYLEYFFDYLWGGKYIYSNYGVLAHNFILEAHDSYGIISTFSLIGIIFCFFINIFKLIKIKSKSMIVYLFISMYVSIFVQMCLEPVFEGYPVLVTCFIFLHGMITAYLKKRESKILKKKREDNNENYRNKYYLSR